MNINFSQTKINIANQLNGIPPNHSPEVWQQWLNELPVMNTGKAAVLIQNALQDINQDPPKDFTAWLSILELFRPPVAAIKHSILENYLMVETIALNKKIVINGLIQTLQSAMADAYAKLAYRLKDLNSASHNEIIAIACHRSLNYLADILLQTYQIYSTPPKGLWLKLHNLYKIARDIDMLDYFATHEVNTGNEQKISLKGSYQRALLISLANLYQLDSAEMPKIYHVLAAWSMKTQLRQTKEDIYLVRVTRDEPPVYRKLVNEADIDTDWLSFDTTVLVAYIERLLAHPEQNPHPEVTPHLLQHLLKSWDNLPLRSFPRIKQNTHMKVCIGLSSVHYFISELNRELNNARQQDQALNNEPAFTLAEITKEAQKNDEDEEAAFKPGELNYQPPAPDIWEPDFLLQKKADEEIQADAANIKPKYEIYDWKVIDSSPAGYGLYSTTERAEALKVGEIIGLQQQNEAIINNWLLGVIRWIRITADGELLLGIQLLATNAVPIRIQINAETKPLRALFIPETDSDQPQAIVTLDAAYNLNTPLTIYHGAKTCKVKLTKQTNEDGRFRWFEFMVM